MSDPTLSSMKPCGRTVVWTYGENRNFPGWHLCCDQPAAAFIVEMIDAMLAAQWPARKTIPLATDPAFTTASGCTSEPRFARSLEIRFTKDGPPDGWRLEERDGKISLSIGCDMIKAMRNGVLGLTSGRGDYAIGDGPCLWFWWEARGV